jgi:hypothetical protein
MPVVAGAGSLMRSIGGTFERLRASAVKCCEVRVLKAKLLPLVFGCAGFILGFLACRVFFVPSASLEQLPAMLPSVSRALVQVSDPTPREDYRCTIVNPTFPPQVMGVWELLKLAAEEMFHPKAESTIDGL